MTSATVSKARASPAGRGPRADRTIRSAVPAGNERRHEAVAAAAPVMHAVKGRHIDRLSSSGPAVRRPSKLPETASGLRDGFSPFGAERDTGALQPAPTIQLNRWSSVRYSTRNPSSSRTGAKGLRSARWPPESVYAAKNFKVGYVISVVPAMLPLSLLHTTACAVLPPACFASKVFKKWMSTACESCASPR